MIGEQPFKMSKYLLLTFIILSITRRGNAQEYYHSDSLSCNSYVNILPYGDSSFVCQYTVQNDTIYQAVYVWIDKLSASPQKEIRFDFNSSNVPFFLQKLLSYNERFVGVGINPSDSGLFVVVFNSQLEIEYRYNTDSINCWSIYDTKIIDDQLLIGANTSSGPILVSMSLTNPTFKKITIPYNTNGSCIHFRKKDSSYTIITQDGPRDSLPDQNEAPYYLWTYDYEGQYKKVTAIFPEVTIQDTSYRINEYKPISFLSLNDSIFFISALCYISADGYKASEPIMIKYSYQNLNVLQWNTIKKKESEISPNPYITIGYNSIQADETEIYQLSIDLYKQRYKIVKYDTYGDLSHYEEYVYPTPLPSSSTSVTTHGFNSKNMSLDVWGLLSQEFPKRLGIPYYYRTPVLITNSIEVVPDHLIRIYPNPTQNQFTIDYNFDSTCRLKLFQS
jgi:hypothetical protein